MKRIFFCLAVFFIYLGFAEVLCASCTGDCLKYCGPNGDHGYCVDYIQFRLGTKQKGNANEWTGNVCPDDVRRDDVAIFGPTKKNPYPKNSLIDKDSFIIQSNYTYTIS